MGLYRAEICLIFKTDKKRVKGADFIRLPARHSFLGKECNNQAKAGFLILGKIAGKGSK